MYRQAIRPLARYPLTAATTTVRGLSTLPLRRVGQPTAAKGVVATIDAQSRPRISPLSAQAAIFKRLYATEETTEKANHPGRSNVEFQHTTTGAREEARNAAKDFAEIIAGRSSAAAAAGARENVHHHAPMSADFTSVTRDLAQQIPDQWKTLGALGTIPYIGTSLSTIFMARECSLAAQGLNNFSGVELEKALSLLSQVEQVQITYGAVLLSFLGALHWGLELAQYGESQGYKRLIMGVAPALFAWPTTFLPHGIALAAQWAGFTGTWMIDQRASTLGWTPSWFSTYRFYLSIVVGLSIITTLTATSYYGVGAGNAVSGLPIKEKATGGKDTQQRINAASLSRPTKGTIPGGMAAVDGVEEGDDGYIALVDKEKEAEEAEEAAQKEKEKEQEKKEKAEKQDTKEINQAASSPESMKTETKGRVNSNDVGEQK